MTTLSAFRGIPLSALCLSATVLLSGCGGGGGSSGGGSTDSGGGGSSSSEPDAVKNFTLTPQATKTLKFSWDDVADETEYRLLENPDGHSGFEPVATITPDSVSHDLLVSLPSRINAQYILQSCNDKGCSDSAVVSVDESLVSAVGYFKATYTSDRDSFGESDAVYLYQYGIPVLIR